VWNDINRRVARLAISWYAVDPVQIEKILRQAGGAPMDFTDELQKAGLITPAQADNLRAGQAPTQVDINVTPGSAKPNGHPVAANNGTAVADEPKQLGPYRILRRLGQGGMGAVYLAFDPKENRQVAVKTLSMEHAPKANLLLRFQQEGRNGASLAHANIVRSFAIGHDAATGLHYIVLEYVDGPSAHDLLDRFGPMRAGDAIHIILDIARALEYAHGQRVIHRDVKPSNILLTRTGVAKLSDLGLAKRRDDNNNLTNTSQSIGTPYYMPYEQALNARFADERSDIYALGATLYHLLTGEVPFGGESTLEIVEKKGLGVYPPLRLYIPDVPTALEVILGKMLSRDPQGRYQTVSELIVDLERSQLADTIPSFVDRDLALQDPVVKKQWAVPVAPTSPDLRLPLGTGEPAAPAPIPADETWYLRYLDREGNLCKSRVSATEILERLQEDRLSTRAEASRSLQGDFRPLKQWPEFKEAVATARQRKAGKQSKSKERTSQRHDANQQEVLPSAWLIAGSALGVVLIAILGITLFYYFRGT
jgi:serine/threonine-protein kinase